MEYLMIENDANAFKEMFAEQRRGVGGLCARESDKQAFINLFYRRTHLFVTFDNDYKLSRMEVLVVAFDLVLSSIQQTAAVLGVSVSAVNRYHERVREKMACYSKKLCLMRISQANICLLYTSPSPRD